MNVSFLPVAWAMACMSTIQTTAVGHPPGYWCLHSRRLNTAFGSKENLDIEQVVSSSDELSDQLAKATRRKLQILLADAVSGSTGPNFPKP